MDKVTKTTLILPATLALLLSGPSVADDLTDAVEGLCDTIKTCALEAVAGQDLTDELRVQMAPMLDSACTRMRSRVQAVPADHALYQPAVGCMRSMESLTCQQLNNAGQVKTPECTEYDRLASETTATKQ